MPLSAATETVEYDDTSESWIAHCHADAEVTVKPVYLFITATLYERQLTACGLGIPSVSRLTSRLNQRAELIHSALMARGFSHSEVEVAPLIMRNLSTPNGGIRRKLPMLSVAEVQITVTVRRGKQALKALDALKSLDIDRLDPAFRFKINPGNNKLLHAIKAAEQQSFQRARAMFAKLAPSHQLPNPVPLALDVVKVDTIQTGGEIKYDEQHGWSISPFVVRLSIHISWAVRASWHTFTHSSAPKTTAESPNVSPTGGATGQNNPFQMLDEPVKVPVGNANAKPSFTGLSEPSKPITAGGAQVLRASPSKTSAIHETPCEVAPSVPTPQPYEGLSITANRAPASPTLGAADTLYATLKPLSPTMEPDRQAAPDRRLDSVDRPARLNTSASFAPSDTAEQSHLSVPSSNQSVLFGALEKIEHSRAFTPSSLFTPGVVTHFYFQDGVLVEAPSTTGITSPAVSPCVQEYLSAHESNGDPENELAQSYPWEKS